MAPWTRIRTNMHNLERLTERRAGAAKIRLGRDIQKKRVPVLWDPSGMRTGLKETSQESRLESSKVRGQLSLNFGWHHFQGFHLHWQMWASQCQGRTIPVKPQPFNCWGQRDRKSLEGCQDTTYDKIQAWLSIPEGSYSDHPKPERRKGTGLGTRAGAYKVSFGIRAHLRPRDLRHALDPIL